MAAARLALFAFLFWPVMAEASPLEKNGWKIRCETRFNPPGARPFVMKRHLRADGSFFYQHGASQSTERLNIGFWLWGWRSDPPDISFGFSAYSIKRIGKGDVLRFLDAKGREIKSFESPEVFRRAWDIDRKDLMQWLPQDGKITVELRRPGREGRRAALRHSGHFDAARLREEIEQLGEMHRKLDAKQKDWKKRCIEGKDLVENPQADIWCPVYFRQDNVHYSSGGGNLRAQVSIGKSMYMNISRGFYENAPAQAFVDKGLDAFTDLKWFVHATIFNRRQNAYKQEHRVEILNGGDRIHAKAIGDRVDYKILRKWDARPTPTIFRLFGKDGEVIEETRFAPGSLKEIEDRLRSTVAAALKKRENPLENCEPPQEIIVT